jgi:PAS domain S-box-containing protein
MNLGPASLVSPVETADQPRPKPLPEETSKRGWNFSSLGLVIALAVLLVAIRLANFQSPRVTLALWISLISAVLAFALLSVGAIRQLRWRERQAKTVIEDREREFHEMADNIQEIFWVIDAETKKATYVNPAYQIITGHFSRSLLENPSSYEEVIHPDDRAAVLAQMEEAARSGSFDERFRIVKLDGEICWIWVCGFPRSWLSGSLPSCDGKTVDPGPHIPSYLYMARNGL